jgi:hypothetical protein
MAAGMVRVTNLTPGSECNRTRGTRSSQGREIDRQNGSNHLRWWTRIRERRGVSFLDSLRKRGTVPMHGRCVGEGGRQYGIWCAPRGKCGGEWQRALDDAEDAARAGGMSFFFPVKQSCNRTPCLLVCVLAPQRGNVCASVSRLDDRMSNVSSRSCSRNRPGLSPVAQAANPRLPRRRRRRRERRRRRRRRRVRHPPRTSPPHPHPHHPRKAPQLPRSPPPSSRRRRRRRQRQWRWYLHLRTPSAGAWRDSRWAPPPLSPPPPRPRVKLRRSWGKERRVLAMRRRRRCRCSFAPRAGALAEN